MAATTGRIRIGASDGQGGGGSYDAAPGPAYTLLATGACNIIIKFAKQTPPVEIWHGATGLPTTDKAGLICDWDDGSLTVALLAGNSIYYRAAAATQFSYSKDA